MEFDIEPNLRPLILGLTDENYEESFARYQFWFQLGQSCSQIPPGLVFNTIWNQKTKLPRQEGTIIFPTCSSILRFVSDAESDHILASYSTGIRTRLCRSLLQGFYGTDVRVVHNSHTVYRDDYGDDYLVDANLIAHCANLGYIEEAVIRHHILQSLIYHPSLHNHQADALIILFKIAGATFGAYVDHSVIDRCFDLLGGRNIYKRRRAFIDVSEFFQGSMARTKIKLQEVIQLRKSGWEGLPPPPVFTTEKPKPTGTGQKVETGTAISLGLPNVEFKPQTFLPSTLQSITVPETGATTPSVAITRSPSISVATLSDFTIADTSDDEFPVDPTAITPHDTFYLEDGNVEVLCGNTLFRVHTSILCFHSPVLRQEFAQASLAVAESPNGCPRLLSSDTGVDFTTLLKIVYLPGYVFHVGLLFHRLTPPRFPERGKVPDFNTFSSLLRITAKYEMPAVRSELFEVVNNAYPETFEGVTPTKLLGEAIFSGPTPHPNKVLNLFVQQNLTSALPMAYYMAVRRGVDSLMDSRLPQSASLPPAVLQSAIKGFVVLRELELNQTHRLVLSSTASHSSKNCPSCKTIGPLRASDAHQKVIDRITGFSRSGTKVLEVLSLGDICAGDSDGFCVNCVRGWEIGHVEVRKRAWDMLPEVFGLK